MEIEMKEEETQVSKNIREAREWRERREFLWGKGERKTIHEREKCKTVHHLERGGLQSDLMLKIMTFENCHKLEEFYLFIQSWGMFDEKFSKAVKESLLSCKTCCKKKTN
jgi:hypothetical protein